MSTVESRSGVDSAFRAMTERLLETASDHYDKAARGNELDPSGHHLFLAYLNWLTAKVEKWREIVMQCIEDPPDVTGNPWPDCICNDARYELGHMESCPAYGRPPDMPDDAG